MPGAATSASAALAAVAVAGAIVDQRRFMEALQDFLQEIVGDVAVYIPLLTSIITFMEQLGRACDVATAARFRAFGLPHVLVLAFLRPDITRAIGAQVCISNLLFSLA